jgi:hypothetical protein
MLLVRLPLRTLKTGNDLCEQTGVGGNEARDTVLLLCGKEINVSCVSVARAALDKLPAVI